MDRRAFLVSTLALAGCGAASPRQVVICDPGLGAALMRARARYPQPGALVVSEARPQALLEMAEGERSALVVTRQSLIANRLQRLGHVRLEHRWQARIGKDAVQLLVTRGGGPSQWRALKLARWLASDAGAAALGVPIGP
ncbi:MAG TPA: hypothetical protein PLO65_15595 [Caulobacter sp.]|nr:hypothetical protein [Caulobacter sp.]